MLVLVNSTVHQAGVSTMAKGIAFTYSNWINRPVLLVSIRNDSFYKSKCGIKPTYESKFLSIVNGNTGSHGDLKVYTYKVNELLYYYQAHSSPASPEIQHRQDLSIFLQKASRDFGMVVVDLDDGIASFANYLNIAEMCFTVLPPDKMVLEDARNVINDVLEGYREEGGLAVKTKMKYIINRMDGGVTKSSAAKMLGAKPPDVFSFPYDVRFLRESNNNRLLNFLTDTLLYKKSPADKAIEVTFQRIYRAMREG